MAHRKTVASCATPSPRQACPAPQAPVARGDTATGRHSLPGSRAAMSRRLLSRFVDYHTHEELSFSSLPTCHNPISCPFQNLLLIASLRITLPPPPPPRRAPNRHHQLVNHPRVRPSDIILPISPISTVSPCQRTAVCFTTFISFLHHQNQNPPPPPASCTLPATRAMRQKHCGGTRDFREGRSGRAVA